MSSSAASQPSSVQPAVINDTFLPVKTCRGYILVSSHLLPSVEETRRIYPDQPVAYAPDASPATPSFNMEPMRPFETMEHAWPVPDSWINGYYSCPDPSIPDLSSVGFTNNFSTSPMPDDEMPTPWLSWLSASSELDFKPPVEPTVPFYRSTSAMQARQILLDPNPCATLDHPKVATEHTLPRPR
ncbi:hypothetical protein XA68_10969 [Ophiocordyceps unilateralis]|uniref:Uncharacterized protein n=1 Tax=Ophiocordyceps unilateralis TaxID=268505 RepID=A0A2A9PQD4_OPHUN|nr:hypothetical protein XA68_10969 [Ophiocordyceps unilateralis]